MHNTFTRAYWPFELYCEVSVQTLTNCFWVQIQILCLTWVANTLLPALSLFCYTPNAVFPRTEVSNFDKVQMTNFFSLTFHAFCAVSKKSFSTPVHKDVLLFFPRSFVVLGFIVKSMVYFALILWRWDKTEIHFFQLYVVYFWTLFWPLNLYLFFHQY